MVLVTMTMTFQSSHLFSWTKLDNCMYTSVCTYSNFNTYSLASLILACINIMHVSNLRWGTVICRNVGNMVLFQQQKVMFAQVLPWMLKVLWLWVDWAIAVLVYIWFCCFLIKFWCTGLTCGILIYSFV